MLSFHILIAVLAGATATVALQRPNHFALPVFLLLLALFSGLLVASFHAFSDIEILRRRVFGLRRHVSDLLSLNGSAGPGDPGSGVRPSSESDRANYRPRKFRLAVAPRAGRGITRRS